MKSFRFLEERGGAALYEVGIGDDFCYVVRLPKLSKYFCNLRDAEIFINSINSRTAAIGTDPVNMAIDNSQEAR